MPIFEYVCRVCGSRFEKLVLSSQNVKKVKCPDCGAEEVEKAISRFSASGNGAKCSTTGG